jgi:MFS family permease
MKSSNRGVSPLPYRKIFILGLILFSNNCSIWMIFSYLPFMVLYYFPELTPTEVGYRCGILGSAFSMGSLFGNFCWGIAADKYGRRPTLMLGLLGTALAAGLFGFSSSFWLAVFSRFLWGCLNGNIGIAKTYMGEITDDTNAAKSMAIFGAIGGAGRTVGPLIGGFLSQPASKYPSFKGTVFETYPFSLPPVVVVTFCLLVFIIAYFDLSETLSPRKRQASRNAFNVNSKGDKNKVGSAYYSKLENGSSMQDGDDEFDLPDEGEFSAEDSNRLKLIQSSHTKNDGNVLPTDDDIGNAMLYEDDNADTSNSNPSRSTVAGVAAGIFSKPWNNKRNGSSAIGYSNLSSEDEDEQEIILSSRSSNNNNNMSEYELRSKLLSPMHSNKDDESSSPCSTYQQQKLSKTGRKVSFNSLVEVKTIDTTNIEYNPLKRVTAEDVPIHVSDNGSRQQSTSKSASSLGVGYGDNNNMSNDTKGIKIVKYSNGSEFIDYDTPMSIVDTVISLLSMRLVYISCILYGLISFAHIMMSEVFPLWLVIPVDKGGFGFDSSRIGVTIMISGPVSIVTQVFVYPILEKKYGVLKVFRIGIVCFTILAFLIPSITIFSYTSKALPYALMVTSYTLMQVVIGWSYVCVFVFVNNSCYSHQRATVNGIGQTCAAVGRMVGPYFAGLLFASTASSGFSWPINYSFTFYVICAISFCIWAFSKHLPNKIQRRRREPKNPRYAVTMEKAFEEENNSISSHGANDNNDNGNFIELSSRK